MNKLWVWRNGDCAIVKEGQILKNQDGRFIDECKFCGKIPTIVNDPTTKFAILCKTDDCPNSKRVTLDDWNQ